MNITSNPDSESKTAGLGRRTVVKVAVPAIVAAGTVVAMTGAGINGVVGAMSYNHNETLLPDGVDVESPERPTNRPGTARFARAAVGAVLAGALGFAGVGSGLDAVAATAGDGVELAGFGSSPGIVADIRCPMLRLQPQRDAARSGPLAVIDDTEVAWLGQQRRLANDERIAGRYGEAEARFVIAIDDAVAAVGNDHLWVAVLRNDLAITYKYLGRLDEAERLYREALAVLETSLGPNHAEVAAVLHNLGGIAHARGDLHGAEPLARRAVELRAAALGDGHLTVACDRAALAAIIDGLGRHDEAEAMLRQALTVFEQQLGTDHYEVAVTLHNLAAIAHRRGDLDTAASLAQRSLDLRASILGDHHPELASTLNNLAATHRAQHLHSAAAANYCRALDLLTGVVDENHPTLRAIRHGYTDLQRAISTPAT
jgi:tetratricopeptide (TPR) repeat protein